MLPATDNITAYRGDTIREVRHFVIPDTDPVEYYDPTGCTPTAQIRTKATSADILYTFACELIVGATELDPSGVVMEVEADVTAAAPSSAVWDYQLEFPDGAVRTFGAGKVKFSGEVTR